MPVSTKLKKEAQKLAIPRMDDEMFVREDFDQKRLRYEFAGVQDISIDQETIKTEDIEVMDPSTLEMPVGPAGAYDDHGTAGGVETIMVDGQEWDSFVYNGGFTWHPDMDDVESVERQRTAIENMFHFLGDINFFMGMDVDGDGTNEYQGMFEWLRSSIPSKRTFDCEDYDGDSGDEDFTDVPEDLIRGEVIEAVYEDFGGSALDASSGFDLAIGSPTAIQQLEGYSVGSTTDQQRGPTFMQRLQNADTIQDAFKFPYKLQPDYLHDAAEDDIPDDFMEFTTVDLNTAVNPSGMEVLGYDELFLIPDVDKWMDEYVDLRESASPNHYGPVEEEFTGAEAHGYKWRYGHKWNPMERHDTATDVVHIQNVSQLFGKNN